MTSIRSIVCISRLWLCLVIVIIAIEYSQAENFPVDPENEPKKEVHIEASHEKSVSTGYMGASGSFVHGFIATLSVILVSELGDKTFFYCCNHGNEASKMDSIYWSNGCSCNNARTISLLWVCHHHHPKIFHLLHFLLPFCGIWYQNVTRRLENVSK